MKNVPQSANVKMIPKHVYLKITFIVELKETLKPYPIIILLSHFLYALICKPILLYKSQIIANLKGFGSFINHVGI